jgi:diacylglycerol kinase family enzyme
MVVIANSRQYAVRIDPAEKASMTDGQLDAVVFPCRGPVSAAIALARCRIRKHGRRVVYKQGRSIRVHAEDPRPPALQIDGECQRVATGPLNLLATVRPAALKVLVPQT